MEKITEKSNWSNRPRTIDVSLTGACQLDCPFCWGEDHAVGTVYGEDKWKNLLRKFRKSGTSGVVFTGGEPLTTKILPGVLRYAKETLSMRITLSTNAILLKKQHRSLLPWVDDLGLPLDGSTPEVNKLMRPGEIDNFNDVIEGIKLAQRDYPNIDLTVRSVVARPNINDIANVPQTLLNNGVDPLQIRYKLYQIEPIGPRADVVDTKEWRVTEDECRLVEDAVRGRYPLLSVALQLYKKTSGRYYQIGPMGNACGTYINRMGIPQMVDLGNPMTDFDNALEIIDSKCSFLSTH